MSDLVTRLRDVCYCVDGDACGDCQAIHDAAKEIERLRAEQRDAIDPDLYAATVAENNDMRMLLRECRPIVSERKLAVMCNGGDDECFRRYEAILARLDAFLGGRQ